MEDMEQLASEIRSKIIEVTANNGGHLGPNLGVVELTLALHRVFETPLDQLVFDVSHQGYVHKLLTGATTVDLTASGSAWAEWVSQSRGEPAR
jgi:1-deoxy-D-xylulose-5-phosphate synthase